MIILQTPYLKLRKFLIEAGRDWFAAERTSKGDLLAGVLLVLFVYGLFIFLGARAANDIATTSMITCLED